MEPSGLAVGVFALAGLFNNAVDCFEYVHLGRSFGTNFQTSLLKLDHARVRLSRWGEAVGISGDLEDTRSLKDATIKQEDIANAQMILGQILKLFVDAEKSSAKYKNFETADDPNLTFLEAPADMDAVGQSLHEKMRALCIKRQNSSKLYQKAKWALYDKKHFKRLIEDIKELVDALLDLFPSVKQAQLKLCEAEVSEIGVESLPVLSDIVRSQDEALEKAISAAIKSAVGKQSSTFNNYNSKIANQAASMAIHGGQTINL